MLFHEILACWLTEDGVQLTETGEKNYLLVGASLHICVEASTPRTVCFLHRLPTDGTVPATSLLYAQTDGSAVSAPKPPFGRWQHGAWKHGATHMVTASTIRVQASLNSSTGQEKWTPSFVVNKGESVKVPCRRRVEWNPKFIPRNPPVANCCAFTSVLPFDNTKEKS